MGLLFLLDPVDLAKEIEKLYAKYSEKKHLKFHFVTYDYFVIGMN